MAVEDAEECVGGSAGEIVLRRERVLVGLLRVWRYIIWGVARKAGVQAGGQASGREGMAGKKSGKQIIIKDRR